MSCQFRRHQGGRLPAGQDNLRCNRWITAQLDGSPCSPCRPWSGFRQLKCCRVRICRGSLRLVTDGFSKYEVHRITTDQLRPAPQFPVSQPRSDTTKVKDPRLSTVRPIARPTLPARSNPQAPSTGSYQSTSPPRPAFRPPLTRNTRRGPLPASQPPQIKVLDRAGHYAHLELAPDWTYLSEKHEKQVFTALAETRRTQLTIYHPDVGDGDRQMLIKRSQDINVAFASLNTCES
jgi:hypothetical protein